MTNLPSPVPPLVTLGETLVLLSAPEVGPLRHAHELRLGVGGSESNVAIGVRRLGVPAAWIGRVGDDELGEVVLRTLRAEGVDVRHAVVDPEVPTSLMLKERRTAATARVTYYRRDGPGARLSPEDVPEEAIRAAGVLHLSGITLALSPSAREAARHAATVARDAGVPVSFDVNYRAALWTPAEARDAVLEFAGRCDHLFVGDDEAALLGLDGTVERTARALRERGPEVVVVKRGKDGAVALVDDDLVDVPPVPVHAVDAVGAGDAFDAGYLAGLLEGRPVAERLTTAAACGAYAVTVAGDWEGLPEPADLRLLDHAHGSVVR
ncbi:sugar kinase [Patulibacter sp. S7RM1-6]